MALQVIFEDIQIPEHLFGRYVIGFQKGIPVGKKGLRVGSVLSSSYPDLGGNQGVMGVRLDTVRGSGGAEPIVAEPGGGEQEQGEESFQPDHSEPTFICLRE